MCAMCIHHMNKGNIQLLWMFSKKIDGWIFFDLNFKHIWLSIEHTVSYICHINIIGNIFIQILYHCEGLEDLRHHVIKEYI